MQNKNKKRSDLKSCKIYVSFEDIQESTKVKWKSLVKQHKEEKTIYI